MPTELTRRGALRACGLVATGGITVGRGSAAVSGSADDDAVANGRFVPSDHGFGFRNWGSTSRYFEEPAAPPTTEVRTLVRREWREAATTTLGMDTTGLPRGVTDALARQLRASVAQRAGTNGHCYGMTLAAQAYHSDPESIPVDRPRAARIEHPTEPLDSPEAPVYDEIVARQADQFLRFRSWIARLAILRPAWLDQAAVLRDVRRVVDATGSASVVVFDDSWTAHQVLAHRVEQLGDGYTVQVYDPNRAAATYVNSQPSIRFVRRGGDLVMQPYGEYTGMVYSRYDQIERTTDRGRAGPLDHFTVDKDAIRGGVFPIAQVVVDSDDVAVTVIGPDEGEPMGRLRGRHMDRSRGRFPRIRTCYGAVPGEYRVRLLANADTEYELRALIADERDTRVDTSRTGVLTAGDVHEYDLTVATNDGSALRRQSTDHRSAALAAGAGAAAGVGATLAVRRARERDE